MYRTVRVGEKDIPMLSMASVDVYYRNIFREDPIAMQAKGMDDGETIVFIMRMGFVMAKFAELKDRKEMRSLNEDSYLEWLDCLERSDYLAALPEIRAVYEGQNLNVAEVKKTGDRSTGP